MKKKLIVFGYGLGIIALLFACGSILKYKQLHWNSIVFLICSVVFFATTALRWQALEPGYILWMKVAHVIGLVVTTGILTLVYFVLFAPVGIFLRLVKKDHLDRRWDKAAATYWQKKDTVIFTKEKYQQQF